MKIEYFNNQNIDSFLIDLIHSCLDKTVSLKDNWVKNKEDGTPVTNLDLALDNLIFDGLSSLKYKIPIVSEERKHSEDVYKNQIYWIVDPLDGTRSYVNGKEEYTINIALIYNHLPIIGLIAHPPSKKVWYARLNNLRIFTDRIEQDKAKIKNINNEFNIIISKENQTILNNYIELFKNRKIIKISSSLKFCKLAENHAYLYPRFSRISKWDIAAGHAILNAAGGKIYGLDKENLTYNNNGSRTQPFFAVSDIKYKKIIFDNYDKLMQSNS
ncbi:MAG: 3'(2'),5'-bisphosphate nucleotidase CysQ [Alphaproteobacteria bacterium MarineAlpha9_Bin4]|nr:hypothetical protein [Pelagibacterales bacterium]PPR27455.1 MAG: 3'(2'),5'-bisphosphate nucleotidase CysQ [Alphaproteobacteria bacterium MarineAlpha9_Bin4]|tara:strand:+ start:44 stop:856 length:813 start_codon:yes stop_codon:yes gene_type:complete